MKARIKVGWEAFWRKIYRDLNEPFRPLPSSLSEGSIVTADRDSATEDKVTGKWYIDITGADGKTGSIDTEMLEQVDDDTEFTVF